MYVDVVSMIAQDETLQPTTVQNDVKTGIETALDGNVLYPAVNSNLDVHLPQLGTESCILAWNLCRYKERYLRFRGHSYFIVFLVNLA